MLDNLGSHKSKAVHDSIRSVGERRLFLLAYSSDFNPIARVFSKRKTLIRTARARTCRAAGEVITAALTCFPIAECANYLINSGYASA